MHTAMKMVTFQDGYRTYAMVALSVALRLAKMWHPDLAGQWDQLYQAVQLASDALIVVYMRLAVKKAELL